MSKTPETDVEIMNGGRFRIEVRDEVAVSLYGHKDHGAYLQALRTAAKDAGWHDCGEGPWETREEAEDFARAEVGVEYRIVEVK